MGRKRRIKGRDWSKKRDTATSAKGRTDGGVEGDRSGGGTRKGRNTDGERWFQTWVLRNRAFEAYYQAMGIMDKKEWPLFMKVLRDPLPACFRVHSDCSFKEQIKKQLMEHLSAPMMIDGKEVKAVEELKWYPGGLAYRLGCDRRFIRKQPNLAGFHTWLTNLMETGNITRQEAVSMLPPLFLDVQPKNLVLDMCAAPGSKTAQLIEMVSAREGDAAVPTGGLAKEDGEVGLVVANDGDRDRTYMLAHQCKRVKCPAVCITWCLAQALPNLGACGAERGSDKGVFDRVLADVPCSGDGTLRKQPSIWRTWTVAGGLALHPLQLLIALRGAAVLKVGGKMVYSTCSLNPIEDEAVVVELLRRCKGNLQLLDCSSMLTGLKTRRGLDTWPVLTGSAKFKGVKTPRDARSTEAPADSKMPAVACVDAGGTATPPASASTAVALSTESAIAPTNLDDSSKADGENGVRNAASAAEGGKQSNGDEGEVGGGDGTEPKGEEGVDDASLAAENEGQGEEEEDGQQDMGMEGDGEFPWPAVASDTPLQDAVKAGLRHHPSFTEKDDGTSRKMRPSFFPPSAKEAEAFKLERCMRMLPQDQDTGGFFVAVLAKTGPILWQDLISPGENLAGDEKPAAPGAETDPSTVTPAEGNLQKDVLPQQASSVPSPAVAVPDAPPVAADSSTVAASAEITVAMADAVPSDTNGQGSAAGAKMEGDKDQEPAAGETIATDDDGRHASAATAAAMEDEGRSSSDAPRQGTAGGPGRGGGREAVGWGERGRGGRGRGRGRGRGKANAHRPEVADREEYVRLEEEKWPKASLPRAGVVFQSTSRNEFTQTRPKQIFAKIKGWFGIGDDFPVERLYTRKAGSKGVSYVAPATKRYLLDDPAGSRLQMVHAGVKVFERNSNARSTIEFRVCQEGLDIVLPYMTKRVTRRSSAEDMSRALDGETVPMEAFSPAMQSDLEGEEEGTYVMVHTDPVSRRAFSACVWKGRGNNIAAMISKDIICGLKLEMKALGVYVNKSESR